MSTIKFWTETGTEYTLTPTVNNMWTVERNTDIENEDVYDYYENMEIWHLQVGESAELVSRPQGNGHVVTSIVTRVGWEV